MIKYEMTILTNFLLLLRRTPYIRLILKRKSTEKFNLSIFREAQSWITTKQQPHKNFLFLFRILIENIIICILISI